MFKEAISKAATDRGVEEALYVMDRKELLDYLKATEEQYRIDAGHYSKLIDKERYIAAAEAIKLARLVAGARLDFSL